MTSLESMKRKLEATRLYSISVHSNVYKELCAYSAGLDILRQELDTMEREMLVSTAESYGLERPERLWGAVRDDMPIEKRREMIVTRNIFNLGDFTPQGIGKILRFLGINGTVEEHPDQMRMVADLSQNDYTKGQRAFIVNQIRELFPAHLDIDIVFRGLSWSYIDSMASTFSVLENRGLTWTEIDYLIGDNNSVII